MTLTSCGGWDGTVIEDETVCAKYFEVDGAGIRWSGGWTIVDEVRGVVEEILVIGDNEWQGELMTEMFGSDRVLVKSLGW